MRDPETCDYHNSCWPFIPGISLRSLMLLRTVILSLIRLSNQIISFLWISTQIPGCVPGLLYCRSLPLSLYLSLSLFGQTTQSVTDQPVGWLPRRPPSPSFSPSQDYPLSLSLRCNKALKIPWFGLTVWVLLQGANSHRTLMATNSNCGPGWLLALKSFFIDFTVHPVVQSPVTDRLSPPLALSTPP